VWKEENGVWVPVSQFFAFDPALRGGVEVAIAGGEIITADGSATSLEVRTYAMNTTLLRSIVPFTQARGVLSLAGGDVDGDGTDEVIVARGALDAPTVRVFEREGELIGEFSAYADAFLGGVQVAAGDVDGDGAVEIITGPRSGGGPQVRIFDKTGQVEGQFFAFDSTHRLGVQVGVVDANGDGVAEIIAAEGAGGPAGVSLFDRLGDVLGSISAPTSALSI
jgi:hypothetical protein